MPLLATFQRHQVRCCLSNHTRNLQHCSFNADQGTTLEYTDLKPIAVSNFVPLPNQTPEESSRNPSGLKVSPHGSAQRDSGIAFLQGLTPHHVINPCTLSIHELILMLILYTPFHSAPQALQAQTNTGQNAVIYHAAPNVVYTGQLGDSDQQLMLSIPSNSSLAIPSLAQSSDATVGQ